MAIVTATITVNFIANYTGAHRVCFRIQSSGDPYDCSTIVNCAGGATACQAIINTPVNTTSCDGPVVFEGYIQAQCEDILSTNGRLLWTANFTPNVVCEKYNITCELGEIIDVPVPVKGSLYLDTDTITITPQVGDTGAGGGIITLDTVGGGVINTISSLLASGVDYLPGDEIYPTGGSGVGGIITIDTVNLGGEVLTYTLTNGGSLYYGDLTFDVTNSVAGVGANFEIIPNVDFDERGSLQTFTIVNPGEYSLPPTIDILTGTGSGAVFGLPPLGGCPAWLALGVDCIGGDTVDILDQTLEVGSTWATCLEGGIAATPPRYLVDQSGCCIPADTAGTACTDVHLENTTGGVVDVHLTLCGGDDIFFAAPIGTTAVCLVEGGWIDPFVAGFTIVDQGTPCS